MHEGDSIDNIKETLSTLSPFSNKTAHKLHIVLTVILEKSVTDRYYLKL